MNTRPYEYLTAIAEKASLSKAARALGISQPTLSNFLANAEKQLGHTLFERSGRSLIPTEAGLIYLETCRRIIDIKRQTYHSIAMLSDRCSEAFTVGVTPHRGSQIFSKIFPSFYHRYPDVKIELQEGYTKRLWEGIRDGSIDLVLGTGVPEEDEKVMGFSSQSYEELLLCVPAFHPLAELAGETKGSLCSIDIRRLNDTPFVMWDSQTTNYRLIQSYLDRSGVSPTVIYKSNNALLIDTMLQSGIGVGFLPSGFCLPGQNRVYFTMNPPLKNVVGVFYRKNRELTEAQRYFIYLLSRNQISTGQNGSTYFNAMAESINKEFEEN